MLRGVEAERIDHSCARPVGCMCVTLRASGNTNLVANRNEVFHRIVRIWKKRKKKKVDVSGQSLCTRRNEQHVVTMRRVQTFGCRAKKTRKLSLGAANLLPSARAINMNSPPSPHNRGCMWLRGSADSAKNAPLG